MNLSDETTQYLATNSSEDGFASADPRIKNIFVDYNLRTPGRWTGSLAAVIGKSAVLNFGYSLKNYSNMEYSSDGNVNFSVPNNRIENTLQAASTYRIGGEYRLGQWNLRAGYRYQESPYKNEDVMSALSGYSAGLGYIFNKNLRLDFAFDRSERDYTDPVRNSNANNALRQSVFTNYILTLSFGI
jgi:long-subunit fatty acid transport protein